MPSCTFAQMVTYKHHLTAQTFSKTGGLRMLLHTEQLVAAEIRVTRRQIRVQGVMAVLQQAALLALLLQSGCSIASF